MIPRCPASPVSQEGRKEAEPQAGLGRELYFQPHTIITPVSSLPSCVHQREHHGPGELGLQVDTHTEPLGAAQLSACSLYIEFSLLSPAEDPHSDTHTLDTLV